MPLSRRARRLSSSLPILPFRSALAALLAAVALAACGGGGGGGGGFPVLPSNPGQGGNPGTPPAGGDGDGNPATPPEPPATPVLGCAELAGRTIAAGQIGLPTQGATVVSATPVAGATAATHWAATARCAGPSSPWT